MDDSFIYLSRRKIAELQKQLNELEKRMKMINSEQLKRGGLADSWHETASHAVTTSAIENRMYELQKILKRAKEFPIVKNPQSIALGCKTILKNNSGKEFIYQLVHPIEADPQSGLVSIESPLGKLLIGKSIKEKVNLGNNEFEVLDIL